MRTPSPCLILEPYEPLPGELPLADAARPADKRCRAVSLTGALDWLDRFTEPVPEPASEPPRREGAEEAA